MATKTHWVFGEFSVDETEMKSIIDSFLDHGIEPSYQNLCYDDPFKGKVSYDHETAMKCIRDKRNELNEKQARLNELEYLLAKKGYPEKYKEFLFKH